MNDERELLLEVPKEYADELIRELEASNVEVVDPEEAHGIDGATIVQFILVVTPVISSAAAKIIAAWRNKTEVVIKDGERVYKGYTAEDVKEIMNPKESG